jgi:hypothetical protein
MGTDLLSLGLFVPGAMPAAIACVNQPLDFIKPKGLENQDSSNVQIITNNSIIRLLLLEVLQNFESSLGQTKFYGK